MTLMTSVIDGTTSFTNDDDGQLTAATYNGSGNSLGGVTASDESYTYDGNGNRTASTPPASATEASCITATGNELTSDGTYTYIYDNNGNCLTKSLINGGTTYGYTWDYDNRLIQVATYSSLSAAQAAANAGTTTGASQVITYTYDAYGRRIREMVTDGAAPPTYDYLVYDDNSGAEPFMEFTAANGLSTAPLPVVTDLYLNAAAVDQVLADDQLAANSDRYGQTATATHGVVWLLPDQDGTPRDLLYSSGSTYLLSHRVYNSFGVLESVGTANVGTTIGYAGMFMDANPMNAMSTTNPTLGLQLLSDWNRWYDPTIGRFISPDPAGTAGSGTNLYAYCGNGPMDNTDPTGEDDFGDGDTVSDYSDGGGDAVSSYSDGGGDAVSSYSDAGGEDDFGDGDTLSYYNDAGGGLSGFVDSLSPYSDFNEGFSGSVDSLSSYSGLDTLGGAIRAGGSSGENSLLGVPSSDLGPELQNNVSSPPVGSTSYYDLAQPSTYILPNPQVAAFDGPMPYYPTDAVSSGLAGGSSSASAASSGSSSASYLTPFTTAGRLHPSSQTRKLLRSTEPMPGSPANTGGDFDNPSAPAANGDNGMPIPTTPVPNPNATSDPSGECYQGTSYTSSTSYSLGSAFVGSTVWAGQTAGLGVSNMIGGSLNLTSPQNALGPVLPPLSAQSTEAVLATGTSAEDISKIIANLGDVYVFRGTTLGFPGNLSTQQVGVTPASIDPLRATAFAAGAASQGSDPVVLFGPSASFSDSLQVGTWRNVVEREVGVPMLPADFQQAAPFVVDLNQSQVILNGMGYNVPPIMSTDAVKTFTVDAPRLSPDEIAAFVRAATAASPSTQSVLSSVASAEAGAAQVANAVTMPQIGNPVAEGEGSSALLNVVESEGMSTGDAAVAAASGIEGLVALGVGAWADAADNQFLSGRVTALNSLLSQIAANDKPSADDAAQIKQRVTGLQNYSRGFWGWAATIFTLGDASYKEQQAMAIDSYTQELADKYGYEASSKLGGGNVSFVPNVTTTYHKKP